MTETKKEVAKKTNKARRFLTSGGGVGSGIIVAWAWNVLYPNNPMPPEVAAAIGGGLVLLVRWVDDLVKGE